MTTQDRKMEQERGKDLLVSSEEWPEVGEACLLKGQVTVGHVGKCDASHRA